MFSTLHGTLWIDEFTFSTFTISFFLIDILFFSNSSCNSCLSSSFGITLLVMDFLFDDLVTHFCILMVSGVDKSIVGSLLSYGSDLMETSLARFIDGARNGAV